MSPKALKWILLIVFISTFSLPKFLILAQEETINLEELCQSMDKIDQECQNLSSTDCRQLLEKCSQYYEEKSAQIEKDLSKTEQDKKTLQNQIYLLKKKIEKLDLQIKESNMMIKDLTLQITDTELSINQTSLKIENSRNQLSNILRTIYEEDQKSLIEILLSEKEISDFFDNLMALKNLNSKGQELLKDIKDLKSYLESQKEALDEEKTNLENVLKIQILQRKESESTKKEKDYFLKLTEAQYQKQLKEKEETEKRAAEIRLRIFELIGVPPKVTFGEAYELAKYVEKITGVRPALLLAVMTQESNLFVEMNVGQCYLVNLQTGEGVRAANNKREPKTMNPQRDIPYFISICQELGRDPLNTPVSCPMSYGWGGAMGPAQFIPSTWMRYRDGVKEITGKLADPWDIKDAFLAAALYLADYGATKQTQDSEWKAAMIYFSGTTNTKYRFYGDSVLSIATRYEEDIEAIEKGGLTQFLKNFDNWFQFAI